MAATEVGESVAAPRNHLRYRPHLDGLRTVAVYLVLAFHAGLHHFRGGFIGVDVFYVLSGFLVTSVLLRDLAFSGRVGFRRFYSRRVRRILPAAVVTLLITAVAYAAIASPSEMLDSLGGFRAAFLYVANWFFIGQATDYFAASVNASPVLHFWSLAIEEQFYLAWPLLLSALYLIARQAGRRRWWVVRAVVAAAATASAIAAVRIGSTNLVRAYYGTDTRAYQLLVGALLALTPQLLQLRAPAARRLLQWCVPCVLGALVVLGTSVFDVGAITRGILVVVLAAILIVALENAGGGTTKRMLSSPPFTYLGRVSYGTYLWHWPVIVLATHERRIDPLPLFLIACTLATLLAALSYRLLEHPVRTSRVLDRYKGPVVALGFASSIVAGLFVVPIILDRAHGSVSAAQSRGSPSGPLLLDWRVAKNDIPDLPDCLHASAQRCTLVHGTGARVLLMGDSNARMWIPAFTAIAEQESLTLSVAAYPDCPWQNDLTYLSQERVGPACKVHRADWYGRVITQLDPDVIFLAHQAFDDPARPTRMVRGDGTAVSPADVDFEQTLIDASASALRALAHPGRKLVIIEPIPITFGAPSGFNPLSCISTGSRSECTYEANRQPTPLEQYYRRTGVEHVYSLDLDRLVCPRWPTCDEVIGDIIVKRDPGHLTATFARSLAGEVDALLRKDQILTRL